MEKRQAGTSAPKPSVGRIVHFGSQHMKGEDPKPLAAIVTYVHEDGKVNLTIFSSLSADTYHHPHVEFSEKLETNKWTWPPRV